MILPLLVRYVKEASLILVKIFNLFEIYKKLLQYSMVYGTIIMTPRLMYGVGWRYHT